MTFRPIIRPILQTYVNALEVDFVHGYHDLKKICGTLITDKAENFAFVISEVF